MRWRLFLYLAQPLWGDGGAARQACGHASCHEAASPEKRAASAALGAYAQRRDQRRLRRMKPTPASIRALKPNSAQGASAGTGATTVAVQLNVKVPCMAKP